MQYRIPALAEFPVHSRPFQRRAALAARSASGQLRELATPSPLHRTPGIVAAPASEDGLPHSLRVALLALGMMAGRMKTPATQVSLATAANPVRLVLDEAQFMDVLNGSRMEGYLRNFYLESGVDFRVVFARRIPGDIDRYALRRMRELGIGQEVHGRGLLLVYDVEGQRMRMEIGPGLEGLFPDGFVGYLMRGQTAAFFASGDRVLALKSTLFIISNRVREDAIRQPYDPSKIAYIKNSERLALGAGTTTIAPVGSNAGAVSAPALSSEARVHFAAQPTVALAHARYLEALRDGYFQPDLPIYTPASAGVLRRFPVTPPYAAFILYSEYGHQSTIVQRGDLAILYFTSTPFVSTHHFHRSPDGWQLDLAADVRNTRELVGNEYTWIMTRSGDEYNRTFADQYSSRKGFLRPTRGDNRPLPMWNAPH